MQLVIFAKKRFTQDGKIFYTYLTSLEKKDGESVTVAVKFRDIEPPKHEVCPCNIVVDKKDCNLSVRKIAREDTGEIIDSRTLWVKSYSMGDEFVDKSLDEYEFD